MSFWRGKKLYELSIQKQIKVEQKSREKHVQKWINEIDENIPHAIDCDSKAEDDEVSFKSNFSRQKVLTVE